MNSTPAACLVGISGAMRYRPVGGKCMLSAVLCIAVVHSRHQSISCVITPVSGVLPWKIAAETLCMRSVSLIQRAQHRDPTHRSPQPLCGRESCCQPIGRGAAPQQLQRWLCGMCTILSCARPRGRIFCVRHRSWMAPPTRRCRSHLQNTAICRHKTRQCRDSVRVRW